MGRDDPTSHREHASALAAKAAGSGTTDRELRLAVLAATTDGAAVPEPYRELATQIARNSAGVTDAQVAAVVRATGSAKEAFEVILTAAVASGLQRWDAAERAIKEASDASA